MTIDMLKAMKEMCSKDDKRPELKYIYYTEEDGALVATDGARLLLWHLPENIMEHVRPQFEGNCYCQLIDKWSVSAISEEEVGFRDSVFKDGKWKRVIPSVPMDSMSWPKNDGGLKKYAPFYVCTVICRKADVLLHPLSFDKIKTILPLFAEVHYPHIETIEEEDERLAREATMSEAEKKSAKEKRERQNQSPVVLKSADDTLTYVICQVRDKDND